MTFDFINWLVALDLKLGQLIRLNVPKHILQKIWNILIRYFRGRYLVQKFRAIVVSIVDRFSLTVRKFDCILILHLMIVKRRCRMKSLISSTAGCGGRIFHELILEFYRRLMVELRLISCHETHVWEMDRVLRVGLDFL